MKLLSLILSLTVGSAWAQASANLEADLKQHPDHLSTRVQLATYHLKQGQFTQVIELLNAYTDQLNAESFQMLGFAYSNKKDYINELRVLNLLVKRDEENYKSRILLGQAYLKAAGEYGEGEKQKEMHTSAVNQLRKAVQLAPQFKPGYDLLLNTLLKLHESNEARELLAEGIKKFGPRAELYRELCRLDSGDGFLDQAVEHCREGIKLAPEYPDNYVFLVQSLNDQKEDKQAESAIKSAAKHFPNSEFVQWAAGKLFFERKNFPVAARYFQAAVKALPSSGRAEFGLARSMFESGDEQNSLAHFIKACESDATSIDTFLTAGGRLKLKGNQQLGELFVRKANTCRK